MFPWREKKASQKGSFAHKWRQKLFVEEANEDTGLQVGDQILALDGSDLEQIASLRQSTILSARPPEDTMRMGGLGLSPLGSPCFEKGIEKTIKVVPSREPIQDQIFWKRLDDEILYLRLDNFLDEGAISRV